MRRTAAMLQHLTASGRNIVGSCVTVYRYSGRSVLCIEVCRLIVALNHGRDVLPLPVLVKPAGR
jgi:hypothetical protein